MNPVCILTNGDMSDGSSHELERWMQEASLDTSDCSIVSVKNPSTLVQDLHVIKPAFIVPLAATGETASINVLCPSLINTRTKSVDISKWRGSLLRSAELPWPHYLVPAFAPKQVFKAWDERQNAVLCFAKLAEELAYWKANSVLQPLPQRQLIADPAADDCIDYLRGVLASPPDTIVSIDIENIGIYKGKYKTPQRGRVPYVIGFAIDPLHGVSVGLAEYDSIKAKQVWSLINAILRTKKQVGQNYYTHDLPWLQFIGFDVNAQLCDDTLVRHHCLWPELSHKLDYQTFQYTREPYYKDEGKNWSVKERNVMKRYNCKDVCVTLEIYLRQEEEFRARA